MTVHGAQALARMIREKRELEQQVEKLLEAVDTLRARHAEDVIEYVETLGVLNRVTQERERARNLAARLEQECAEYQAQFECVRRHPTAGKVAWVPVIGEAT